MYRWIWRQLPGSPAVRTVEMGLLVLAAAALLWLVVFPWASIHLPVDQAGIG
jgi:hypothetical protein